MRLGWRNVSAVKARLTQQNCKNYESKVMRNAIPCEDPQCPLQIEAFLLYSNMDIHSTICNLQPPASKMLSYTDAKQHQKCVLCQLSPKMKK